MSRNARVLILLLGLIATAVGLGLTVANGGGIPLIVLGLLMLASLIIEPRYGRPGKQRSIPHSDWQLTDEKFYDDETGQPVEVWIDPLTGATKRPTVVSAFVSVFSAVTSSPCSGAVPTVQSQLRSSVPVGATTPCASNASTPPGTARE